MTRVLLGAVLTVLALAARGAAGSEEEAVEAAATKLGPEEVLVQVQETKGEAAPSVNVHVHTDRNDALKDKDVLHALVDKGQAKPMPIKVEKPHGGKVGLKKPLKKKKKGGGWMALLLIPMLLQAKLVPLVIAKLKLLAVKALIMGKLALLLLAVNLLYGLKQKDNHQQEATLAKEHYGFTGGPEYGAWVNRRAAGAHQRPGRDLPYRGQQPPAQ